MHSNVDHLATCFEVLVLLLRICCISSPQKWTNLAWKWDCVCPCLCLLFIIIMLFCWSIPNWLTGTTFFSVCLLEPRSWCKKCTFTWLTQPGTESKESSQFGDGGGGRTLTKNLACIKLPYFAYRRAQDSSSSNSSWKVLPMNEWANDWLSRMREWK